jgi:hypothetical protein
MPAAQQVIYFAAQLAFPFKLNYFFGVPKIILSKIKYLPFNLNSTIINITIKQDVPI